MTVLMPIEKIIAKLLVDSAINKKGNFTYSEISDILEKEHGETVNPHYGLSKPLGNIAILCNELGLPLLSVRVHYKNDTSGRTAEGFYSIACDLKPEYKSMKPNEVRSKELELTRSCSDWQRLLDYLDEKATPSSQNESLTIPEQIELVVGDIITQNGIGYIVSTQEIETELIRRYGTNRNSILPFDYCYNRLSSNRPRKGPLFFEYLGRTQYRVLGKDYPYNGDVLAHPQGGTENIVGYCINGQQYMGKPDDFMDKRQAEFRLWLENTTTLSDSSLQHYVGAIKSISEWLNVNISEIFTEQEILDFENKCTLSPLFIEKDSNGNRMYSVALKHYKNFVVSTQAISVLDDYELIEIINDSPLISEDNKYSGVRKIKPALIETLGVDQKHPRDVKTSKNALCIAKYQCENDVSHLSFKRKTPPHFTYTEPHHLIPLGAHKDFEFSLDIEENICSLCSTCHNCLHYGKDDERDKILERLYEERKIHLTNVGLEITLDNLKKYY